MKYYEKELIKAATNFKGAYLSGFYIQNPATITALSFLFEKIYLPNQLEFVIEYSKTHLIELNNNKDSRFDEIKFEQIDTLSGQDDPLEGLNDIEATTAKNYLFLSQNFCIHNHELFPEVFITDLLEKNEVFDVELVKEGKDGKLNEYNVKVNPLVVSLGGMHGIKEKLENGYVPIIGKENIFNRTNEPLKSNQAVAAILAMKSIEMLLPSFKSAKPQEVLEARDKLSDVLPSFWSSMLKLSIDSKKIIADCKTTKEAILECQNVVDTIVRPALVELVLKMEKERKNWFYKVLSPVANTARLFIGNPMLSQAQLIKSSFELATNSTTGYFDSRQKIDDLKTNSGLTYLLEIANNLSRKA